MSESRLGLSLLERAIWPGDSNWNMPAFSPLRSRAYVSLSFGGGGEGGYLFSGTLRYQGPTLPESRVHFEAEDVELWKPNALQVVLVVLDPIEGHSLGTVKLVKRQGYGRANTDLLKARVMAA